MLILITAVIFLKAAEFIFSSNSQYIIYTFAFSQDITVDLFLGYRSDNDLVFMVELIIISILILVMKGFLKKKKYEYWRKHESVEKRSVQLINVHKEATEEDVKELFSQFHIDEIVFSYRVSEYFSCLKTIMKLKK